MLHEIPTPEDGVPSATISDHRQTLSVKVWDGHFLILFPQLPYRIIGDDATGHNRIKS